MKKLIYILIFWLIVSLKVVAETLGLVGSNWPPYIDKNQNNKGLAMEIVETALLQKGYRIRANVETWPRVLEGVEIGVYDVVAAIWKTPEREEMLIFSNPYLVNHIKFIKMKNTEAKYQNLEDLTGYLIGVVKDYAYDEAFLESQILIKIPQNHIVQNLLKLTQGEIDLTLGDERAVRYEINQYMSGYAPQMDFLSKPLSQRSLHIAVSKQNPNAKKIVADFNQAITKMKKDGSFDTIVKKYDKYLGAKID
jgi:polar amino acid transport system substrate-binding protein